MERPTKFEAHRWLGDKRNQIVYDVDNLTDADTSSPTSWRPSRSSASAPTPWPRPATAATAPTSATAAASPMSTSAERGLAVGAAVHLRRPAIVGHVARPTRAPGKPAPGVVICHGYPSVVEGGELSAKTFPELAERIANELGWVALVFCLRGCGESEGNFSLSGWLNDLLNAAAFLRTEEQASGVWVVGFGTGGAISICAAARDPEIRGVAAVGAPADFDDWASHPRRLLVHSRELGIIRDRTFPPAFDQWSRELREIRRHRVRRRSREPPPARHARLRRRGRPGVRRPGAGRRPRVWPTCGSSRVAPTSCATIRARWPSCSAGSIANATRRRWPRRCRRARHPSSLRARRTDTGSLSGMPYQTVPPSSFLINGIEYERRLRRDDEARLAAAGEASPARSPSPTHRPSRAGPVGRDPRPMDRVGRVDRRLAW